jgi:hypothetical protein
VLVDESETLFDTGAFVLDGETRKAFTVSLNEGDWVGIYAQAEGYLWVFAITQDDWIGLSKSRYFSRYDDYTYYAKGFMELLIEECHLDEDIEGVWFIEDGFQCPSTGYYTIYILNDFWLNSEQVNIFSAVRSWQETVTVYLPEVKTRTVTKYRTVIKERIETHTKTVTRKGTILELIIG